MWWDISYPRGGEQNKGESKWMRLSDQDGTGKLSRAYIPFALMILRYRSQSCIIVLQSLGFLKPEYSDTYSESRIPALQWTM